MKPLKAKGQKDESGMFYITTEQDGCALLVGLHNNSALRLKINCRARKLRHEAGH